MLRSLVCRRWLMYRPLVILSHRGKRVRNVTLGLTLATVGVYALQPNIYLDAYDAPSRADIVDPATDIHFPAILRIPSRVPLPQYTLLGVGVRKVSFLGIKAYSVGFFADLDSVPPIKRSSSFEEKLGHIVEHSSCVIRIIPTRSTSYSHMRDGFMRTLQSRMTLQKSRGHFTPEDENDTLTPMLKFKSLFPNTPLTKHTPMDVILTPPSDSPAPDRGSQDRQLIVRDLGSISNNWIAKEFILAYFEGQGISPPLRQAVEERLQDFGY